MLIVTMIVRELLQMAMARLKQRSEGDDKFRP
jgi:hypothetical protein